MTRAVILRSEAESDVQQIFDDLARIESELSLRFIARLRETLERIEAMPEMYATVWHDVRAVRLRRFRYVVYYVLIGNRIEVLAVMHGSRNTSSWKSRL